MRAAGLDGGGSSTLVVAQAVVNRPSQPPPDMTPHPHYTRIQFRACRSYHLLRKFFLFHPSFTYFTNDRYCALALRVIIFGEGAFQLAAEAPQLHRRPLV